MKKICAIAVVLVLASALAFAKGEVSPQTYLANRGLTVMDEDQVYDAFGTNDIGGDMFTDWFPRETISIFAYVEYSDLPMIVFKDCGIYYLAVEREALSGYGSMSAEAMSAIYVDFCREYPFDIMMASQDGYNVHLCAENSEIYSDLQWFLNSQGDTYSTLYDNMDAFINTVYNFNW